MHAVEENGECIVSDIWSYEVDLDGLNSAVGKFVGDVGLDLGGDESVRGSGLKDGDNSLIGPSASLVDVFERSVHP